MRWLHNILHWRCEREVARLDALLAAAMPRYQPVSSPPGTMPERIERALRDAKEPAPEREGPSGRWPEKVIEWREPA